MKTLLTAMCAAASLAFTTAAHAGFSFELTGPSVVEEGETATFNLLTSYVPYAPLGVAPDGLSYTWIEYAYAAIGFGVKDATDQSVVPFDWVASTVGRQSNTGVLSGDFDPASPYSHTFTFFMSLSEPGTYTVNAGYLTSGRIARLGTAACTLDVGCDPGIMADNWSFDAGGSGNRSLSISVTPVPEPEAYAMLMAGVGLVGFVARRRMRKSKPV